MAKDAVLSLRGGMKSLMLFLQRVLEDLENLCGTSTRLDLKEIQSRVENEGISFLTISLPSFGEDFQKKSRPRLCSS